MWIPAALEPNEHNPPVKYRLRMGGPFVTAIPSMIPRLGPIYRPRDVGLFMDQPAPQIDDGLGEGHVPERRGSPRTAFCLSVRVTMSAPPGQPGETARHAHVPMQDVSGSGISIIYAKQLCLGQKLEIEMPDRPRSATVVRIESTSDRHYLISCQFTD
jgi:hypothetical protein